MKRAFVFLITFLFLLLHLCGCIIIPLSKTFEIDADAVSSVEFYDLCEADRDDPGVLRIMTARCALPDEDVSSFLDDLSKIRFTDQFIISFAAIDPSFSYSTWTARINYRDGSYEFLSCAGYGETFDQNNNCVDSHHFGCEKDEWEALIKQYVSPSDFSHSHEMETFSYQEDLAYYKGEVGTKTSGFLNTEVKPIKDAKDAANRAKQECTVAYDSTEVAFDPTSNVYRVSFVPPQNQLGGDQTVYLDQNGITLFVVYGE